MKAITLQAGWAHAVTHLGKDVENRSWRTHHRGMLAIHAGQRWGGPEVDHAFQTCGVPVPDEADYGAVVAVVDLVDVVDDIVSPWATPGYLHWVLSNTVPLPVPVPTLGRLGLWTLPDDVENSILEETASVWRSAV